MRAFVFLLPAAAALPLAVDAQPAEPAPISYRSIELHGGGLLTVRYGATRGVTVRQANPDRQIRTDGDRLVVDRCSPRCSRGHRIEVEVVTPDIARLAVSDGGLLQIVGDFPRQPAVAASVNSGGTIDLRAVEAASVSAAVSQGGRILTRPGRELAASILDGGNVTYWGDPTVRSSVQRGGVVARGAAGELGAPVARLDQPLAPLHPIAPPKPPRPIRTQ